MQMKQILTIAMLSVCATSAFAQDADPAAQCSVAIEGDDTMHFNIKSFTIDQAACPEFTIDLKNVGALPKAAMGHNVVITATDDFQAVAKDGGLAGLDNNHVKPDDERVIVHTDVIGSGEETEVTFDTASLEAGKDYTFFCSFPGHSSIMKGSVVVK